MQTTELVRFKKFGKQIIVLTAWDAISSSIVEASGADIVLVGDSLGMVVLKLVYKNLYKQPVCGEAFDQELQEELLSALKQPFQGNLLLKRHQHLKLPLLMMK